MQKLLLGALLVGLVVGCAMEEEDSSGVLVDSSQEVEVPDWVTAAYLDLNKDGTVDLLDLVIHSKFFGQTTEIYEEPAIDEAGIPDLSETIYAIIELEQAGVLSADLNSVALNSDYPDSIKVALRFKPEKTGSAFSEDFNDSGLSRDTPEFWKHFITNSSYRFSEVKVKIVESNGGIHSPSNQFSLKPYFPHSGGGGGRFVASCSTTPSDNSKKKTAFSTRNPKIFLQLSENSAAGRTGTYAGIVYLSYPYKSKNIREYEKLSCGCQADRYRSSGKCGEYHQMKYGLHLGEPLDGNADGEQYTNAYINVFTLWTMVNNDLVSYTFYTPSTNNTINKPLAGSKGRLIHQFLTPSIQQQIKEEHFPEDE